MTPAKPASPGSSVFCPQPFGTLPPTSAPSTREEWGALELRVDDGDGEPTLWLWHFPVSLLSPPGESALGELTGSSCVGALGDKVLAQFRRAIASMKRVEASLDTVHLPMPEGPRVSIARLDLEAYQRGIHLAGAPQWLDAGLRELLPGIAPMAGPFPASARGSPESLALRQRLIEAARADMERQDLAREAGLGAQISRRATL